MMALVRYETDELDFALHSSHAFYLQVRLIKKIGNNNEKFLDRSLVT